MPVRDETSIRTLTLEILHSSRRLQGRAQAFFDGAELLLQQIQETPIFDRLRRISQLDVKRNTLFVPEDIDDPARSAALSTKIKSLTRAEHSRQVCAHAIAFGLAAQANDTDLRIGAIAALLHDVGHAAMSHSMEETIRRFEPFDHEENGLRLLEKDRSLQRILNAFKLDLEGVVRAIREEGPIGARQNVADTCTYLRHDGNLISHPNCDYGPAMVKSLRQTTRDGLLVVVDPKPFVHMLTLRAKMYALFYEHPYNQMLKAFLRELAALAIEKGVIRPIDIIQGTDTNVWKAFRKLTKDATTDWIPCASALLRGRTELAWQWRWEAHADEATARAWSQTTSTEDHPVFLIPPFDRSQKRISVRLVTNHAIQHLQAADSLRPPHHRLWHTLTFVGPRD